MERYNTILSKKEERYIELDENDLEDFNRNREENLYIVPNYYMVSWMKECNKRRSYVTPISLERTNIN